MPISWRDSTLQSSCTFLPYPRSLTWPLECVSTSSLVAQSFRTFPQFDDVATACAFAKAAHVPLASPFKETFKVYQLNFSDTSRLKSTKLKDRSLYPTGRGVVCACVSHTHTHTHTPLTHCCAKYFFFAPRPFRLSPRRSLSQEPRFLLKDTFRGAGRLYLKLGLSLS